MSLNVITTNNITKLNQQIKALEYQLMQDTSEKDIQIHNAALKKLKEELLYKEYLELQSKEFKEDLIGCEEFIMPRKDIAIKVNFTWGWLQVYRTQDNQIEWY